MVEYIHPNKKARNDVQQRVPVWFGLWNWFLCRYARVIFDRVEADEALCQDYGVSGRVFFVQTVKKSEHQEVKRDFA